MSKDKANIFNLDDEEFKDYEKDPFCDCFESIKTFANALKRDIETKETPHVLLLEAEYGMGKTFFSTRFAYYLNKKCGIDTIYFSVWENDYYVNPFIAFSKAIISYIAKQSICAKLKCNNEKLLNSFKNVIKATKITFGTDLSIKGKGIKAGIDLQIDDLIKSFQSKKDPICEFKKQLKNYISDKTKSKKLVIIVDELDRCRPDYAMKTLECIKHFFDIENLFIILPTNKNALNDSIQCLYGINNTERPNKENYFRKFFNDTREIKKPTKADYKDIVQQYIKNDLLDEAIKKKFITLGENYNSINTLVNSMAKYSCLACITPRELKDICFEIVRMCNNFYEPVRCEWLACLMTYKRKNKDYNFNYPLPQEHCFYENNRYSPNSKMNLFKISDYTNSFRNLQGIGYVVGGSGRQIDTYEYKRFVERHQSNNLNFKSYEEVNNYFNNELTEIQKLEEKFQEHSGVINNLNQIKETISQQKNQITDYQNKYGSDDEDDNRKKRYEEIVKNPEMLYSQK